MSVVATATKPAEKSRFARLSELDKQYYVNIGQDLSDARLRVSGNGMCTFHYVILADNMPKRDAEKAIRHYHGVALRSAVRPTTEQLPSLTNRVSKWLLPIFKDEHTDFRITAEPIDDFVAGQPAVVLHITHHN